MDEIGEEIELEEALGWKILIYDYEGWVYKELYRGNQTRSECWHKTHARAQVIQEQKDWMCGEGNYEQ